MSLFWGIIAVFVVLVVSFGLHCIFWPYDPFPGDDPEDEEDLKY